MNDLLFDVPANPVPVKERGKRMNYREKQARNVAMGLHPTGRPLGPEGKTCRDCLHRYENKTAATYWKCETIDPDTVGLAASDIKLRWPACSQLEEDHGCAGCGHRRHEHKFPVGSRCYHITGGVYCDCKAYDKATPR